MFEDDVPNRWANCSVERACELLAKPWVRVYEQSDKVVQLQGLRHLEFHVRRHFVKKVAASSAGGGARPKSAPARAPEQPAAQSDAPRKFADLASLLAAADVPASRAELFEKEEYGLKEIYTALRAGNEDPLRNDLRSLGLTLGEVRRLIAALMP